ncbi:MAG: hypothetical protein KAH48_04505 [Chlorobi bacterium]|nr:hypothetical protein [Chlorobiota bacterium]
MYRISTNPGSTPKIDSLSPVCSANYYSDTAPGLYKNYSGNSTELSY